MSAGLQMTVDFDRQPSSDSVRTQSNKLYVLFSSQSKCNMWFKQYKLMCVTVVRHMNRMTASLIASGRPKTKGYWFLHLGKENDRGKRGIELKIKRRSDSQEGFYGDVTLKKKKNYYSFFCLNNFVCVCVCVLKKRNGPPNLDNQRLQISYFLQSIRALKLCIYFQSP